MVEAYGRACKTCVACSSLPALSFTCVSFLSHVCMYIPCIRMCISRAYVCVMSAYVCVMSVLHILLLVRAHTWKFTKTTRSGVGRRITCATACSAHNCGLRPYTMPKLGQVHAHHMLITCSSHAHHMLITCSPCLGSRIENRK